jgi:hypothetical protein
MPRPKCQSQGLKLHRTRPLSSIAGPFPAISDEHQTISGCLCFGRRANTLKHHQNAPKLHAKVGQLIVERDF